MSFQELCKKYKEEICPYCKNNNINDYNIAKCTNGVKCVNYIKDKSKFSEIKKPISSWQSW